MAFPRTADPYLFSSLGASAYSEHGCGPDLGEQTPQREKETTEAMAILRGWYDRWETIKAGLVFPRDSGWALGKPIRGLNNLGAKSETDYPASQVSFVLFCFFLGPMGPKVSFPLLPFSLCVPLVPIMSGFSEISSFPKTLAPPAVRKQLCKDLEPALSIFWYPSSNNQRFNLHDQFQSLRFSLTGLLWMLTVLTCRCPWHLHLCFSSVKQSQGGPLPRLFVH